VELTQNYYHFVQEIRVTSQPHRCSLKSDFLTAAKSEPSRSFHHRQLSLEKLMNRDRVKSFLRDTQKLQTNLTACYALNTPVILPRVSLQKIHRRNKTTLSLTRHVEV